MRLSLRHLLHTLIFASFLAAGAVTPIQAQEAAPAPELDEAQAARIARFKQTQVRFMTRGLQRRVARYAARAEARKVAALKAAPPATKGPGRGVARKPARFDADPPSEAPLGVTGQQSPASPAAIATNRLVNNPNTDTAICGSAPCTGLPWSGQCEVSIAAHGNNLVAAWNDGEGFLDGSSTQGYAYSNNGGVTWVDGGAPPVSGGIVEWTSDPVVTVNEKTGAFYYSALCDPSATTNGIGVVKGTFIGGVLVWQTPRLAVSGTNSTVIYDKEWLVADSTSSNLYLVYARFTVSGGSITSNRIEFSRNTTDNAFPWSAPVQISAAGDNGAVQGPRVAVGPGPAADVWMAWNVIGPSFDYMKVRKSTPTGILSAEQTAATQYTNFGTGAPGFNRGTGFAFPGLAVDRSTGPNRGRAFLVWNESINFYNDNFGLTTVAESEPNNTPVTGDPFTMGNILTGNIASISDFDYFSFSGVAGNTIICEYDGGASPGLDPSFRLFCSDGTTRMGYTEPGPGGTGLIVFTLPTTATYTLRVAPFAGTGAYTIRTVLNGAVTERARDHRDVFTTFSDNYTTWSTPVRVNGDPGLYDDWLPEIAVAGDGAPYVIWYDWRDSPVGTCGGSSNVYLSRSANGGASWPDGSPVTEASSAWTTTYSNIAPNQGDYISLYANNNFVYACWSDGRSGHPDVYMAAVSFAFTPVLVSVADTHVEPGLVRVTWHTSDLAVHSATVYRRTGSGDWSDLGTVSPDGGGQMVYEDRDVQAGSRYDYRLGIMEGTQETFTGEVTVDVPGGTAFSIDEVRPNPSEREMWVSFSLPDNRPALLELIDVTGRRVRERTVTGAGRQTVDLATGSRLPPGIYIIRLTHDGRTAVKRASVVR